MKIDLLRQADAIFSKCGRPIMPGGVAVPIYKAFVLPMVVNPGQSQVFTREITGDTVWSLRAISSDQGASTTEAIRCQVQLPSGKFLMAGKNGQDLGRFAWIGSYRYAVEPDELCEPGSKLQVTLTEVGSLAFQQAVTLTFEGSYLYYLKGSGKPEPQDLASMTPRYGSTPNQNILAPSWMSGQGWNTPDGYEDEEYTYSSFTDGGSSLATIPISGPLSTTVTIQIDSGYEFLCWRLLVDLTADATATAGVVLGRIRAGSGYTLCDNLMDLQRYIGGAVFGHTWKVKGPELVFVDLSLQDAEGTGNFFVQVHLEGVRRRKK